MKLQLFKHWAANIDWVKFKTTLMCFFGLLLSQYSRTLWLISVLKLIISYYLLTKLNGTLLWCHSNHKSRLKLFKTCQVYRPQLNRASKIQRTPKKCRPIRCILKFSYLMFVFNFMRDAFIEICPIHNPIYA